MENTSLIVSAFSMLGGVIGFFITTFLVLRQIKENQNWNRKKTSEEMLIQRMTGEFPKLMDTLSLEYGWHVLEHVPYTSLTLANEDLLKVDIVLRNVLRHLEVICINMKHEIIDEGVCHEYLQSILKTFYQMSQGFIERERKLRKEPKIFHELEQYAKRWVIWNPVTKSPINQPSVA